MKKQTIIFMSLFLSLLLLFLAVIVINNNSVLSSSEKEFIRNHPILYLAPDPSFGPVEFIDEDGTYRGIAADYIKSISREFDLNIKIVNLDTWNNILDTIKRKEIDILGAASVTPQREEYLIFSETFVTIKGVIITKNNADEGLTEDDLVDKKVLVIEGYSLADHMTNNHPNVDITYVKDISAGLSEVSFGKADALLIDIGQASFYIDKYNYTNLKIAGELDFSYDMKFAFRDDYHELQSIFNKGLQNMSDSEKEDIHNSWIFSSNTVYFNIKNYIYIAIIAILIVLVVFFFILQWNHSLKLKVNEQTATLKEDLEYKHVIEKELLLKNNEITTQNAKIKAHQKELEKLNAGLEDTVEKRTMLLNRSNIELEVSMNSLKDKQAELTHTNIKLHDSLNSLKDTQSQLVESEKQASLGRLVTGISHEINTPLGNSITGISFVKNEIDHFKSVNDDIDKKTLTFLNELVASSGLILNNLEIAANLINKFKQLSINTNVNQIQKININDFLDAILMNLSTNLDDYNIEYKVNADKIYMISTYPTLLEQVIISLFNNSITHGFSSRNTGKVTISLFEKDDFLCINFEDNGKGISTIDSFKIFDPFFTTKRGQGSIGLGLHIVYIIITQVFKGYIELLDKSNGTSFLIHLKLDDF